jgi:uncharacterized membrane protein
MRVGPLPDAEELARYNAVVADGGERIMQAFERQSEHRRDLESIVIRGDNNRAYIGMACGTLLQASVIGGAIYLGAADHEHVAIALATSGSVPGLSTIWASWKRSKERAGRGLS